MPSSHDHRHGQFCHRTRREFFWEAGASFTGLALSGLLDQGFFTRHAHAAGQLGGAADTPFTNPLAAKPPHFAPKAKSVIFLFMYGGPSQVDTFDYKPKLYGLDGKTIDVKTKGRGGNSSGRRARRSRAWRSPACSTRRSSHGRPRPPGRQGRPPAPRFQIRSRPSPRISPPRRRA